jgi:hypothetical protein
MAQPWRSIADEALAAAEETLVGRSHGAVAVESLLWYGAVEIDTRHAVVWVLLSAPDDEVLPRWFSPAEGTWSGDPQQAALDPETLSWMREVQNEARSEFTRRGWPSTPTLAVMFDSHARVRARGWQYFNE